MVCYTDDRHKKDIIMIFGKILFLIIISGGMAYGRQPSQNKDWHAQHLSDIAETYQRVLQTNKFEDRIKLVEDLMQKTLEIEKRLDEKKNITQTDGLAIFHISTFKDLYDQVSTRNPKSCVESAKALRHALYRTRPEDEIFPYERSLYNLFGKMCSLDFALLGQNVKADP